MNELFDLLNSSIKNEFGSKAPLTAANFEEKKIKLLLFYSWLRSLKIKDGDQFKFVENTRKKTCINGFCTTITSVIGLYKELDSEEHGENILFTRHIQQNYLEQFFSIVRQRCEHNDNPMAAQFKYAIRRLLVLGVESFKPSIEDNFSVDSLELNDEETEESALNLNTDIPNQNDPFVEIEVSF